MALCAPATGAPAPTPAEFPGKGLAPPPDPVVLRFVFGLFDEPVPSGLPTLPIPLREPGVTFPPNDAPPNAPPRVPPLALAPLPTPPPTPARPVLFDVAPLLKPLRPLFP